MKERTILALDRGHPGQLEMLEEHFEVLRPGGPDPERILKDRGADIQAITSFLTPIRRGLIEALPNLELIAVGAVGVDHIDLEAARERDIAISHTPDVLTNDTADIAILLMLNIMRSGVEGDAYVRAGLWQNGPLPLGSSLSEKSLGIVGLGRIGQAIAQRAAAFGMDINYFGPNEKEDFPYRYYNDLKEMAEESDVLILSCAGNKNTKWLVDYGVLEALGPRGYIINIARGSVIKERDLLMALSNKAIAGAGLDVFDNEPHVPEELFSMDNVVLTPHIGSATTQTREKMGKIVAGNMIAYFDGQPLLTPLEA